MEWDQFNGNDDENSKPNWDYTQMSMGDSGVCTRWEFKRSNNNERRVALANLSREWESQRPLARLGVNGKVSYVVSSVTHPTEGFHSLTRTSCWYQNVFKRRDLEAANTAWRYKHVPPRTTNMQIFMEMHPMSEMYINNMCIWRACMKNEAQRGAWLGSLFQV